MRNLLKSSLVLLLLSISIRGFAQLDNSHSKSKKGKLPLKIIPIISKNNKHKRPSIPNSNNGFKIAYNKDQKKLKQKQSLKNKGILTKSQMAMKRYNNNFKLINQKYPKIDQDLGSFRTNTKFIKIICRDFQSPDGDRVAIYHGNIPIVKNIILKSSYQSFQIWLNTGINKFSFKALNQGLSGPNTAAFKVYDDTGSLISSNQWNLATGAKATITIAKVK